MSALTKSINKIYKGSLKAFQTFPASIASALAFALVTMVRIKLDWPEQEAYNFLFNCLHWAFALGAIFGLTAVTASQSRRNDAKSFRLANFVSFLLVLGTFALLYLLGEQDTGIEISRTSRLSIIAVSRVSAAITVSFLAFIVLASHTKENSDFSRSFFMTHKAVFIAAIYGMVMLAGASGVAGAIQALLYNDMSEKVYMYISTIAGFLSFTIFVGYFPDFRKGVIDNHREVAQKQPRFVEILFDFIMVPIMLAMTVVLLAWSLRTIFSGDWPSFQELSSIATSYAFVGIWLHLMVTHGKSGLAKFYLRAYPIAAIVILAFEAWAIVVQLGKSGLKTTEYFFILTWIIAVSASIILIVMKDRGHNIIIALICAMVIVSVLPAVGYNILPVNMQVNRLEALLEKEAMLKDGQIVSASEEPEISTRESITDSVLFLARSDEADLPEWFEDQLSEKKYFEEQFGFAQAFPENDNYYGGNDTYLGTSLYLGRVPIEIDDYRWAIINIGLYDYKDESVSVDGEKGEYLFYWNMGRGNEIPSLEIRLNGETIVDEDMNEYFDRVLQAYPLGDTKREATPLKDMSMHIETPEVEVLLVFRNVEASVDTQNDIISYWVEVEALYFNEK